MQSGYLQGALRVLKEEFSLKEEDISGYEDSSRVNLAGISVTQCEIFSGDDNKVCSWDERHENGKVLHSWFEYTQPSFREFTEKLIKQAENSLFLTLRLREKKTAELEEENKKLLEENKKLREEIMELLYAPEGYGYKIAKRHFIENS
ncbi:hypothetical protein ISTM_316 [Insectomime virus]|nr:hypothetical protein ISTM_316 [Insectomime virus]